MVRFLRSKYFRFLSRIIPKKKGLWVFVPTNYDGFFRGNLRQVFHYIRENEKHITVFAVDIKHAESARNGIFSSHHIISHHNIFISIWLKLRAELILVDASGSLFSGNFKVAILWHGVGFKNTGAMCLNNSVAIERTAAVKKKIIFITAGSEADRDKQTKSFLTENVYVTGYPRNDVLFDTLNVSAIKKSLGLNGFNRVIAYAPTFRDIPLVQPFSSKFLQKLQGKLEKENAVFILKRHPIDEFTRVDGRFKNIMDMTDRNCDVQDLLKVSDILISDYSSIVTDFALLRRPIVFYLYDHEHYLEHCRDFYYNLDEVLPGPFAKDESALFRLIFDTEWFCDDEYMKKYEKFVSFFHFYQDAGSTKRVVNRLKEILGKSS